MARGGTVAVWDRVVRLFHWGMVAAVTAAGLTGFFWSKWLLTVHLVAGSAIAALLVVRVVWGVWGGGYARFASVAFSPRVVLAYAREVAAGRGGRHLGHNPLGGAMVFALLAVLATIICTGLVVLGGMDKQGPLASFLSFAVGSGFRRVHKLLALLLVAMVAAHLGGVVFESRREGENLALAMVTGRKAGTGAAPPGGRARPVMAGMVMLGVALVSISAIAGLSMRPGLGVPPATQDADFSRECGACHLAYPPSLLPAASWAGIMAHPQDHFGEDASLAAPIAAHIAAYLAANSAEHWDTLAAVRLRGSIDPAQPGRITATGFWRRTHREIPDAVFASRQIAGRGSCNACHEDAASGRFDPQNIEIPDNLP